MWVYVDIYEIIFGIVFFGVIVILSISFWQFRVLLATFGIGVALFLPIASIYLAYISIFENNLIIVAIIQLALGWTIGAFPFYFFIKPYINFIKDSFTFKD